MHLTYVPRSQFDAHNASFGATIHSSRPRAMTARFLLDHRPHRVELGRTCQAEFGHEASFAITVIGSVRRPFSDCRLMQIDDRLLLLGGPPPAFFGFAERPQRIRDALRHEMSRSLGIVPEIARRTTSVLMNRASARATSDSLCAGR